MAGAILIYDEIGNLVLDDQEDIDEIRWYVNGKIDKITRGTGSSKRQIQFIYDPMGNRIMKVTQPQNDLGNPATGEITYYARDAQGNLMATYDLTLSGGITLGELNMYGSSRLGSRKPNLDMTTATLGDSWTLYRGHKNYELTNHLGNVLTVVSDHRKPNYQTGGTLFYFSPDIVMAQDYYPFGMTMPGRKYNAGNYRFGFNGMEGDDELKGDGNSYDFGARIYDPRIGRWASIDPLASIQPGYSPYKAFNNNPLLYVDPDGRKEFVSIIIHNQCTGQSITIMTVKSELLFPKWNDLVTTGIGGSSGAPYTERTLHDKLTTYTFTVIGEEVVYNGSSSQLLETEILSNTFLKETDPNGWWNQIKYEIFYGTGMSDFKGRGGYQEGGIYMYSGDGSKAGPLETEYQSKTRADIMDVEDLLTVLGALQKGQGIMGYGGFTEGLGETINGIVGLAQTGQELKDFLNTKPSNGDTVNCAYCNRQVIQGLRTRESAPPHLDGDPNKLYQNETIELE